MKSNCEAVTFPSVSWVSSESAIYLSFYGKIVYVFIAAILSKSFFLGPKTFMHMFNVSPL